MNCFKSNRLIKARAPLENITYAFEEPVQLVYASPVEQSLEAPAPVEEVDPQFQLTNEDFMLNDEDVQRYLTEYKPENLSVKKKTLIFFYIRFFFQIIEFAH